MFENRVVRSIFGHTKNEVIGESSKVHNEALHDLYSSPIINRVIQSRRRKWAGENRCIQGERGGI